MNSGAKQRLTGAVILVALFVLLVPELLKGPRDAQPPAQDAQNDGMRQYTIDMNEQNRRAQPEASAPASDPAPALAVPGEAAEPAPADQVEAAPTNPMAAATPAPTAAPAKPPAPAPQTAAPQTAARPSAPHPASPGGNFVVQLGTFGNRENADRLVRDMTSKGFAAFVVPTTSNGRELYRVRVGPTRDRAAAEALAAKLKQIGQSGSIVPIS